MVGKKSAVSKILCTRHNELLSSLDAEAIRAFSIIREMSILDNTQKTLRPAARMVRERKVNGALLERWFLKTLIDLVCVHDGPLEWPAGAKPLNPPAELVEVCFGIRPMKVPWGLRAASGDGQVVNSYDYVLFCPLRRAATTEIAGGMFEFRGLRFVMSLTDEDLEPAVNGIADNVKEFAGWRDSRFLFPFRGFKLRPNQMVSQVLKVTWPPFRRKA